MSQSARLIDAQAARGIECQRRLLDDDPLDQRADPGRQHVLHGQSLEVESTIDEKSACVGSGRFGEGPADGHAIPEHRPADGHDATAGRVQCLVTRGRPGLKRRQDLRHEQPAADETPEADDERSKEGAVQHGRRRARNPLARNPRCETCYEREA
jgi:hypothetical protein